MASGYLSPGHQGSPAFNSSFSLWQYGMERFAAGFQARSQARCYILWYGYRHATSTKSSMENKI